MKKYLFQVEAVNLSNVVYDTADISTIRGGGFYLLYRVSLLAHNKEYESKLVTEGASKAVFRIETEDPEEERKKILSFLYGTLPCIPETGDNLSSKPIKEAMFLVAYIKESIPPNGAPASLFQEDLARLMGKIRVLQMKSPSVRIFKDTLEGTKPGFDGLNRVLPAHQTIPKKEIDVSHFTHNRREFGIKVRNDIYSLILGSEEKVKGWDFTEDLEELSKDSRQGNLSGKIAYIYIDGNKFGALQQKFDESQLKIFDRRVQDFKKSFMASLFNLGKAYPSFMTMNKLKLETLLWGGDEITIIVPAWMGWKVAETFFETAKNYRDSEGPLQITSDGTKDLTFAMGLIFANHKNPVRNLDKIARGLAEAVKNGLSPEDRYLREKGDRMHYAVLESMETLPADYKDFAKMYYCIDAPRLSLTADMMGRLRELVGSLDAGFPRSKLYETAKAWVLEMKGKKTEDFSSVLNKSFKAMELPEHEKKKMFGVLKDMAGVEINSEGELKVDKSLGYRWLQAAELYDYLSWEER